MCFAAFLEVKRMKTISIDIETYSDVNLAKCGVYKYAESPDFEILLFGYAVDGGPVRVIDLAQGETLPEEILEALTDDSIIKWAFNANFERVCLSRYLTDLGRSLDPFHDHHPLSQDCAMFLNPAGWKCSMVWSAYMGLPLSLEGVGAVLNLDNQKMKEGRDLIRYFCVPCKETKTNGGRTRNLPQHAPDKWNLFKSYNKRDVEVEMAIQERLQKYPVPDTVWEEYHQDQEINDRGIAIDLELARQAVAMDAKSRESLMAALKEKTGLENPNSVLQMLRWLEARGLKSDSLGKKQVKELLKTAQEPLHSVLLLRQKLAKSSVKKYQAMEMTACQDGRARGMFQFYGANRTGRFAGRHIQLQNLPQNHLPDLSEARELVQQGNYEALDLLYDSIPDVLSQLIRTAFVPREGMKFVVSDFSAIEARVISWMAGEKWKAAAFAAGKDIYCSTASQMFGVPVVKHGVNGDLRQKGKIAELACIAEGQLVLTDHGLIPIEKVTTEDRVWDGENWVHHDGVVYRGEREVLTYEGLTATADHMVWVQGKEKPIQLGIAAASGAHLLQTGNGGRAIRLGKNYQPGKTLERETEPLLCFDPVPGLRIHTMDSAGCSCKRKSKGCQHCSQARKIPLWLYKRLMAAKQRCENPKDAGYRNYGARGIRFQFPSVLAAGLYLLEQYGLPDREYEIDRINNDGDYAPGNIRMVPLKVNRGNRRKTVLSEFQQEYWPYCYSTVIRKLSGGETREQIIADARDAVAKKRKNWYVIDARLDFMTYEMPDPITVLPYRTA